MARRNKGGGKRKSRNRGQAIAMQGDAGKDADEGYLARDVIILLFVACLVGFGIYSGM